MVRKIDHFFIFSNFEVRFKNTKNTVNGGSVHTSANLIFHFSTKTEKGNITYGPCTLRPI